METVTFDGQVFVRASTAYFDLPEELQIEADRWPRRLDSLRIKSTLPNVRSCKINDITTLEARPVRKSIYVLKTLWDAAVERARREGLVHVGPRGRPSTTTSFIQLPASVMPANGVESAHADASEDTGSPSNARGGEEADTGAPTSAQAPREDNMSAPIPSRRIPVHPDQVFTFEGQAMQIDLYGWSAHDKLLMNFNQVAAAIGFRTGDAPELISKLLVRLQVDDEIILALPFYGFIHLTYLKKEKYPVANHICEWMTQTLFSIQYEGGRNAAPQNRFSDRDKDYSAMDYGINGDARQGIYIEGVCSAEYAAQCFPEAIANALPEGANIADFTLCTPGETDNFRRRTCEHLNGSETIVSWLRCTSHWTGRHAAIDENRAHRCGEERFH